MLSLWWNNYIFEKTVQFPVIQGSKLRLIRVVDNATNIFSLATKNSGLATTLVIKFLHELDLN